MANGIYNIAGQQLFRGQIDFINDPIKAMLVGPSFAFNYIHNHVSDISSFEVSGANYARQTLTGKYIVKDDVLNKDVFFADNPQWNFIKVGPVLACVIFCQKLNDTDSILLASYELSPSYTTNGGIFTIRWSDTGILKISQS